MEQYLKPVVVFILQLQPCARIMFIQQIKWQSLLPAYARMIKGAL